MEIVNSSQERKISQFCSRIGSDSTLVQGAGGNISWKDNDILWIKASGTRLADVEEKQIFVPVDLNAIKSAMASGDFDTKPIVLGGSKLRPSIETHLHALMPHTIVVHLHPVEVLPHLVLKKSKDAIKALIDPTISWDCVGYQKPGKELAKCVSDAINKSSGLDVVFLQNHGIVVGGKDVSSIEALLKSIVNKFTCKVLVEDVSASDNHAVSMLMNYCNYSVVENKELNELATNKRLSSRLKTAWALYPDHVVFLGAAAAVFSPVDELQLVAECIYQQSAYIFILGVGVFESPKVTDAQREMLLCYYDVVKRLDVDKELNVLSRNDVDDLLNREDEKYRINLSVSKVN
jgi:rhamnose utilization protein RhaD (predicted bifunctional aldolase and dehydrogenase)